VAKVLVNRLEKDEMPLGLSPFVKELASMSHIMGSGGFFTRHGNAKVGEFGFTLNAYLRPVTREARAKCAYKVDACAITIKG